MVLCKNWLEKGREEWLGWVPGSRILPTGQVHHGTGNAQTPEPRHMPWGQSSSLRFSNSQWICFFPSLPHRPPRVIFIYKTKRLMERDFSSPGSLPISPISLLITRAEIRRLEFQLELRYGCQEPRCLRPRLLSPRAFMSGRLDWK